MTKEEKVILLQEIDDISSNFEDASFTGNIKLLKEDFDIKSIKTPKVYRKTIDELNEVLRETRLLFLYSVLNKVCEEEGKLYYFDTLHSSQDQYVF